jgi:hypothetical protein
VKRSLAHRTLWLAGVVALVSVLLWLDQSRGGPSTMLSRCNLLLSRNQEPAADVLIVGSSRSGAALDPLAMQEMLAHALPGTAPTVERIALGRSPMRASVALLENYIDAHGAPEVIALELMFMTQRSVDHLASQGLNTSPEHYLFRRDINLMTFGQILALPSVAMPFTEKEGWVNRLRLRLRGVVLRAGALTYQFLRHPQESWDVSACAKEDRTHEPTWPPDFAFSYGSYESDAPPATVIEELEAVIAETAPQRALKSWQMGVPTGQNYPYDLGETYRAGEAALLGSMLKLASRHDVPVVLLPLPLYGYSIGADDLQHLNTALPGQTQVLDLYTQVRGDLDKFWYDDGHLELYPAGALTTAILAQHLLDTGLLAARATEQNRD